MSFSSVFEQGEIPSSETSFFGSSDNSNNDESKQVPQMSGVVVDNRDVSHAFCSQLHDVQYYARRRAVGQYVLHQPWIAYKAVMSKDTDMTIAFLELCVPAGTYFVIGRDDSRIFGIAYWIRVARAIVTKITVTSEDGKDNRVTEDHVVQAPLKQVPSFQTRTETYNVGDELKWPRNGKKFSFSTSRMLPEGSSDGLLVQPSITEAIKVGQTMSGVDTFVQRQHNQCQYFFRPSELIMDSYADVVRSVEDPNSESMP